jgi:hypothetical protein
MRIAGRAGEGEALFAEDDGDRARLLAATGPARVAVARESLRAATHAMLAADAALGDWLVEHHHVSAAKRRVTLELSPRNSVVFGNDRTGGSAGWHEHAGATHTTRLPAYYHALCQVMAEPIVQLQPALRKVWGASTAADLGASMREAGAEWCRVVAQRCDLLRATGLRHMTSIPYPFEIPGHTSRLRSYGVKLRRMFSDSIGS